MFDFSLVTSSSLELLRTLADNVAHAIVTDPPYEIGYKGHGWDKEGIATSVEFWKEALRVARPGAHAVVFGFPRMTFAVAYALVMAGWELREEGSWLFDRNTPKSVNLAAELQARGVKDWAKWLGWGTGLVNCREAILIARKPLDGPLHDNLVKWECGGLNIAATAFGQLKKDYAGMGRSVDFPMKRVDQKWSANVLVDHDGTLTEWWCPKPSVEEREFGLDHLPIVDLIPERAEGSVGRKNARAGAGRNAGRRNWHPTVKPVDLMRYLVAMVLPPGGVLIDPFMGSGTTGCGAVLHDQSCLFLGIDKDPKAAVLADARIRAWAEVAGATLAC